MDVRARGAPRGAALRRLAADRGQPPLAIDGWAVHCSELDIAAKRSYAAVVARQLEPQVDPHGASAAARVDGLYVCSSILPWRSCGTRERWRGARHADKTAEAVQSLRENLPEEPLVWGGDWNHALTGREWTGSQ